MEWALRENSYYEVSVDDNVNHSVVILHIQKDDKIAFQVRGLKRWVQNKRIVKFHSEFDSETSPHLFPFADDLILHSVNVCSHLEVDFKDGFVFGQDRVTPCDGEKAYSEQREIEGGKTLSSPELWGEEKS